MATVLDALAAAAVANVADFPRQLLVSPSRAAQKLAINELFANMMVAIVADNLSRSTAAPPPEPEQSDRFWWRGER